MIYTDDYLMHHGVLGQKWGVRRFQNADGSLTAAGKLHQAKGSLGKEQYKVLKKYAKAKDSSDRAERFENKYHDQKRIGDAMSSDSLRTRQAKNEYSFNKKYEKLDKNGRKEVDKLVKQMGKTSMSTLSTETINTGRSILATDRMVTILAGPIAGMAAGFGGMTAANFSKTVKSYDEGKHVTSYDRYGRISKVK